MRKVTKKERKESKGINFMVGNIMSQMNNGCEIQEVGNRKYIGRNPHYLYDTKIAPIPLKQRKGVPWVRLHNE